MAISTGAVYLPFLESQLTSPFVDFDTDTIKVMLVTSGYTFSSAHQFRSSATAFETSGTNYVAGGQTISNVVVSTSGDNVIVNGDDSAWAGASSAPFSFRGAIVYKDTGSAATDPVIAYHDFGEDITNSALNVILQWSLTPILVYNTVNVPQTLPELDDVSDTATFTNGFFLIGNGTEWTSRLLTEADISDLQAYLTTETNDLTAAVVWANVPDANITQSSVTQHQSALVITKSQISDYDAIANVVEDTTPQLGGNLDVNGNSIVSTTNANINITPDGSGNVVMRNYNFSVDQSVGIGTDDYVLTYDNASGEIRLEPAASAVQTIDDLTDVTITGPLADNELLAYDTIGGKWINQTLVEAGLASAAQGALADTALQVETNDLTAAVTWANVPDANITQSSVTQHVAAIDHDQLLNFAANEHFADAPADAQNYVRVNNTWAIAPTYAFGEYVGAWAANAGTFPVATNQGDWFNVSVAGTVDGESFIVGDTLIALVDSPSTTIYAANWTTVPNVGITDHTALTNIGTNTHAQIDTHIADSTVHFTQAAISITESQISDLQSYLLNVVEDTTPQLGGNLDVQANQITTSTLNGSITIDPNGTGDVILGNYTFDGDQTVGAGQDDYVLTYDNGTGKISLEANLGGSALQNVVEDLTPQLGGDLDTNGFDIVSDGIWNIEGANGLSNPTSLSMNNGNISMNLGELLVYPTSGNGIKIIDYTGTNSGYASMYYRGDQRRLFITGQQADDFVFFTAGGQSRFKFWDNVQTDEFEIHMDGTDANFNFTGVGLDLNITGIETLNAVNYNFDVDQTVGAGQDNYVLTYDNGTGLISLEANTGVTALQNVVEDTTPQLGGHLDVNGFNIEDTGSNERITIGSTIVQGYADGYVQWSSGTTDPRHLRVSPTGTQTSGSHWLISHNGINAPTFTIYNDTVGSASEGTTVGLSNVNRSYSSAITDVNWNGAPGANDVRYNFSGQSTGDAIVRVNSSGGILELKHDSTDGIISTSSGNLQLAPTGDIDVLANSITTTTTNGDIDIQPNGTGNVLLGNLEFDADTPVGATQDGYVLKYDNATGEIDLTPTDAVLIASGTATNVASLVFTDLVSTYGRYQLVIHDVSPSVDGANLNMQVSTDNGSTFVTTATYNWALMFARIRSTGGSANGNEGVWQDTSMRIMSNMGTAAGEDGAAIVDIYDPTNANHYTRISTRATILSALPETRTSSAAGEYSATTAVDAFRILMSTGNIATVDYSLYGYRQA